MYTLAEAKNLFEEHLKNIKFPEKPAELYDPVRYILSIGGKRIRPSLTLLACDLFADSVDSALHPATAIEIFHNFTLLHDDIMDRSELRRGRETVHVKWNENIAILSGDVMSILASRLLNESPGVVLRIVNDIFTLTAMKVCEGQQLDMNYEERLSINEEEYLQMIELKTAVLIAASLKIGAILGGASEKSSNDLYEFGRHLGIAFQLQDDLLDTYGDPEKFGKIPGMDIIDNKKTILMVEAFKYSSPKQQEALKNWISKKDFDPDEKIKAVIDIYNQAGVRQKVEERISNYYDAAIRNLQALNTPEERKTELYDFASNLMKREK